jgi:hypothetical protein
VGYGDFTIRGPGRNLYFKELIPHKSDLPLGCTERNTQFGIDCSEAAALKSHDLPIPCNYLIYR